MPQMAVSAIVLYLIGMHFIGYSEYWVTIMFIGLIIMATDQASVKRTELLKELFDLKYGHKKWCKESVEGGWNKHSVIIFLFLALLIGACSNKEVYDNIQLNNRQNCLELPQSQYDECIARFSKSYDEYERERKELRNK